MNDKQIEKFLVKIEQGDNEDDCWKWHSYKSNGYGRFRINNKNQGAHRISYEYFNNCKIKEGMIILHSCDNPECCNPKHLSEGTQAKNMADKEAKNRHNHVKGERHGNSKLTEVQVLKIREKYAIGNTSYSSLAKEYNIDYKCIRRIIDKKLWKHI